MRFRIFCGVCYTCEVRTRNKNRMPKTARGKAKKSGEETSRAANAAVRATLAASRRPLTDGEHARLVASINSLPIGFVMADTDGTVLLSNNTTEKILHLEHAPRTIIDIGAPFQGTLNVVEQYQLCIKEKRVIHIPEVTVRSRFIRTFFVPVMIPIGHGDVVGVVLLTEDVTEQTLLEQAKNSFVAIAAHELRTPLTIIRGNAELLPGTLPPGESSAKARAMVDAIQRSSIRLLDIVNDFLDIRALEEKRTSFRNNPFDIIELTKEVLTDLKERAAKKNLSLTLSTPTTSIPAVAADRDRTREVIMNIIANALQYTEHGGITVEAGIENGLVKISITDTGVGIEPDQQYLLFQRFQTVSDRFLHSKEYGSGMGLYVSRLLVEGMGGTIWLEKSAPGKGSTFSFCLPSTNVPAETI